MKKEFISFLAGTVVGAVLGVLVGDEDKNRIRKVLNKQAGRLRKEYELPIREGVSKVKSFVKEHLS